MKIKQQISIDDFSIDIDDEELIEYILEDDELCEIIIDRIMGNKPRELVVSWIKDSDKRYLLFKTITALKY